MWLVLHPGAHLLVGHFVREAGAGLKLTTFSLVGECYTTYQLCHIITLLQRIFKYVHIYKIESSEKFIEAVQVKRNL